MRRPHGWRAELVVLAVTILVLAALGPFGSYEAPAGRRLLGWALFGIAGYVFFRPVIAAGSALARQSGLPRPLAIAAACMFGAFPTSLVVVLVSAGFGWRGTSLGEFAAVYVKVLIVGATITIVQLLAQGAREGAEDGEAAAPQPGPQREPAASEPEDSADASLRAAPPSGPTRPPVAAEHGLEPAETVAEDAAVADEAEAPPRASALLDLLPPHLGTEILCLENEDHYVRVHTPRGNALVLMRMRDAVAQLDGQGERVHRSWWVARAAVVALVREDRNLRLKLTDDREVPIARASVAELREKGWLDGLPTVE